MSLPLKKVGDKITSENGNFITISSHLTFTFDIQNFGLLNQPNSVINSPSFSGENGDEWRVQFRHNSTYADAFLQLVHSESKEEVDTIFQMCILDRSKNVLWAGHLENGRFLEGREELWYQSFKISSALSWQNGWLLADAIRFHVQVSTHRQKPESGSENIDFATEQFKSFLINENFADVALTSENSRFPASKIVLAAHSPVFLAMFNSEMLESKANSVVKIEEFSDETIKGFLEFVYTGETESLEENPAELLKISEKYQVLSLKGKCEEILLKNLKIENAVDILVLAHLHSPENLKPKIISFVNKNFKDVKNTESYERMKKEYPQIICDLYENSMK